ncbi:MAG: exodeoxyribonuclease VII large subunit [Hyphomicrobiaceae bacterium]
MTVGDTPRANVAEFTVSDLANAIKKTLEDGFGHVRLRGEISGYRGPHSSGHCYFALKDDRAKIEAVVWRGTYSKLRVKPEEGMEVIVQGKVTSFPGGSKYQIVIETLEPAGIGALMALLEERKRKLGAEGLFDEARKRPIPFLPRIVGIVTSPTGAVIRDMLAGFTERYPARVLVWPVRVQGETSAAEVAAAIRGFNALDPQGPLGRPDTLIVARGGGSLEDLWGFNDEIVVRAVAASAIPVISAVGHETDWTLIDLAADARAPTPTKAAEWAVPKYTDLVADIADRRSRLRVAIIRFLDGARTELRAAIRGLPRLDDLVAMPRQRFDAVERRLGRALLANTTAHDRRFARIAARLSPRLLTARLSRSFEQIEVRRDRLDRSFRTGIERRRQALSAHATLLRSLSHRSVLERGFAIVRSLEGAPVRRIAALAERTRVTIELADGAVAAEVMPDGGASGDPKGQIERGRHGDGSRARQSKPLATESRGDAGVKPRSAPAERARRNRQGSLF